MKQRKFCIWGGNVNWTWIGSTEDRFYVRRERQRVAMRKAAVSMSVLLRDKFTPAMVALGVSATTAALDIERALRPFREAHERQQRLVAAALVQRQLPPGAE